MSTVSEERVLAYVDGELKGKDLEVILAALEENPPLRKQVEEQREIRAALEQAYGPGPEKEDSDFLLPLLIESRPSHRDVANGTISKLRFLPRPFALPQWVAMAASLMLGFAIGNAIHLFKSPDMFREQDGSIIAAGELADNLENRSESRLSGNAIAIPVTFHSGKGFCRVFSIEDLAAGLACRNEGQWDVQSIMRSSVKGQHAQYRLASSSLPVQIMAQVDTLIEGNPMTEEEVRKTQSKGW